MKKIPLTHGKFAIVDDEDFERLSEYNYRYNFSSETKIESVSRYIDCNRSIGMHRDVLQLDNASELVVAKNGDRLDFRKSNLIVVSKKSIHQGLFLHRKGGKSSKYVGVCLKHGKWQATITCGKTYYLGRFSDEWDAAKAYNVVAIQLYGESAKLNIKDQDIPNREINSQKRSRLQPRVCKKIEDKKASLFRGVKFNGNKWEAVIKHTFLGTFDTEFEAAKAYNQKAKEFYGDDAILNDLCNVPDKCKISTYIKRQRKLYNTKKNSSFRGVYKAFGKKWESRIQSNGIYYKLGIFETEEEAAKAYNVKAFELYGEEAVLNDFGDCL